VAIDTYVSRLLVARGFSLYATSKGVVRDFPTHPNDVARVLRPFYRRRNRVVETSFVLACETVLNSRGDPSFYLYQGPKTDWKRILGREIQTYRNPTYLLDYVRPRVVEGGSNMLVDIVKQDRFLDFIVYNVRRR